MEKPFFSIVIPTFNHASFLNETLNSIKKQSYQNFEVIVIDNFSKDTTEEIVKNCDLNIHYEKFDNNGIIGKSRNLGLKISKGEWVCFLDADDNWTERKLELTYKMITKKNFDVICNSEWIKILHEPIEKLWCYGPFKKKNFYEEMLFYGNKLATSATTIKKSFLKAHKLSFSEKKEYVSCEDYDLFLNIAKLGAFFCFLDEPLGVRLIHSSSTSSKKEFHQKSFFNVLNSHILEMKFNKKKTARVLSYAKLKEQSISFYKKKNIFFFIFYFLWNFVKNPLAVYRIYLRLIVKMIKQRLLLFKYKNDLINLNSKFIN